MDIRRFVDAFGDDVFALALMVTKDFDSAKEVFVKTAKDAEALLDESELYSVLQKAYPYCKEAESNDDAVTLTGISLNAKQEALLRTLLAKPQIVRAIVHLTYENDLTPEQTAKLTGESVRYVKQQLSDLSEPIKESLDKHYKEICVKITAEDKLKEYVVNSAAREDGRMFEVKRGALPEHRWNKTQKAIVVAAAVIIGLVICIAIPIYEQYREMIEKQGNEQYENVPTEQVFGYTTDAETEEQQ